MEYNYSKQYLNKKYGVEESFGSALKAFLAIGVLFAVLVALFLMATPAKASTFPDGCTATTKYSATTGHLCSQVAPVIVCGPGDLFSSATGKPCPIVQPIQIIPLAITPCDQAKAIQKADDDAITNIGISYDKQIAAVNASGLSQIIKNDQIGYLEGKKAVEQAKAGTIDQNAVQQVLLYCAGK